MGARDYNPILHMIKIALLSFCLVYCILNQDAVLTPSDPFILDLMEPATYHQSYLIEIDAQQYSPEWALMYAHQATSTHSVVQLEFHIVHKQFPEKQGHFLAKCRLEDQSRRWCRVEAQGINFNNLLIKVKLDCVSDCSGNLTIGFASSQWSGDSIPIVMGKPLQAGLNEGASNSNGSVGFKIIGWMVLTLVLVLLAIQFGQKIANKFDARMQEERMSGLRQKRIPIKTPEIRKKTQ